MEKLYATLQDIPARIEKVVLYKYNVNAVRKFSFGTWNSRQHVFISIRTSFHAGYGENIISTNDPGISLDEWNTWGQTLVGISVSDALALNRSKLGQWRDRYTEMCEMALIDLAGKEKGVSALSLLGLEAMHKVPGAYVILSDDIRFVEDRIKEAVKRDKARVVKVKLFGKSELDGEIVRKVKEFAPRGESYLIGDVNCGYRMEKCEREIGIPEIASHLQSLYEAGLDAAEDPAFLSVDEWVELQRAVSPLSLIPDYPMRPSWKASELIVPGMGDIYNIHPGSAGSILDAIHLAHVILSYGAGLMIGDDSLVGPGCTIWQQLALGLGAVWVEAIEKDQDSDVFRNAIISCNTDSSRNYIGYDDKNPGFGLLLDEEKLASSVAEVWETN